MNAATEAGIVALLAADRSVSMDRIPLIVEVAKGRDPVPLGTKGQQEYLTVSLACSWLHCSRMTLFRLERDGEIESVHLRGKKLFERVELVKALKRGKSRK